MLLNLWKSTIRCTWTHGRGYGRHHVYDDINNDCFFNLRTDNKDKDNNNNNKDKDNNNNNNRGILVILVVRGIF